MIPVIVFRQDGEEVDSISFGAVFAGESKTVEVEVSNVGEVNLAEVTFEVDNPEVSIMSAPGELWAGKTEKLILEYRPSIDSVTGLNVSLKIIGTYVS
jgi:hypothetical protein